MSQPLMRNWSSLFSGDQFVRYLCAWALLGEEFCSAVVWLSCTISLLCVFASRKKFTSEEAVNYDF